MVVWYVWSSGREKWELIEPTNDEIVTFVFQHVKTVDGKLAAIYLDKTGRYVGGFHS